MRQFATMTGESTLPKIDGFDTPNQNLDLNLTMNAGRTGDGLSCDTTEGAVPVCSQRRAYEERMLREEIEAEEQLEREERRQIFAALADAVIG